MANKSIRLTEDELCHVIQKTCRNLLKGRCEEPTDFKPVSRYMKPVYEQVGDGELIIEGLIASYPPEYVEKWIQKRMTDDFLTAHVEDGSFTFNIKNKPELIKNLEDGFKRLGYYCGYKQTNDEYDTIFLQFEPKYPFSLTTDELVDGLDGEVFMYHLSPVYLKQKILANGLIPKSKNGEFKYPDRVYFLDGATPPRSIFLMALMLSQSNKSHMNNDEYSLYKVNVRGLNGVKMYKDMNAGADIAMYTYDNIPPQNIQWQFDFNVLDAAREYGLIR